MRGECFFTSRQKLLQVPVFGLCLLGWAKNSRAPLKYGSVFHRPKHMGNMGTRFSLRTKAFAIHRCGKVTWEKNNQQFLMVNFWGNLCISSWQQCLLTSILALVHLGISTTMLRIPFFSSAYRGMSWKGDTYLPSGAPVIKQIQHKTWLCRFTQIDYINFNKNDKFYDYCI